MDWLKNLNQNQQYLSASLLPVNLVQEFEIGRQKNLSLMRFFIKEIGGVNSIRNTQSCGTFSGKGPAVW